MKNFFNKFKWAILGASLMIAGTAFAVQVSVPSSNGPGFLLQSLSTGNYTPVSLIAGSNITISTTTSKITISATGGGTGGTGNVATSTSETSGYVPFWTTTAGTPAKLGSDINFFWDNTNKRLGISTTTPAAKLDIYFNSAGSDGFNVTNSNAGTGAQVQNKLINNLGAFAYYGISSSNYTGFAPINNGQAFFGSNAVPVSIFTQAANPINFYTNAIQAMVITAGGNVGVGSTTPGSLLSIGGNGTGINFLDNGTSTFSGKGINLLNGGCYAINGTCISGSGGSVASVSNVDGSLTISPTTGSVVASLNPAHTNTFSVLQNFNYSSSTVYSSFLTSSSTFARAGTFILEPATLVGPGCATFGSSGQLIDLGAQCGTVTSVSGSGGTTGLTLTGGPITNSGTLTLGGTLAQANGGTGATSFAPNSIITSNAAGTALIATGTQLTVGNLLATSSTATSTFGAGFNVNAGGLDYVLNTGFVGIGTQTPQQKLEVDGNLLINAAGTGLGIISRGATSNFAGFQFDTALAANWTLGLRNDSTNNFHFFNEGLAADAITLNALTSNVGIGTTTPQFLLNPFSATLPQLSLSAGAGLAQWAFRNAGGNLYIGTTTVIGTATTSISALEIAGGGFGTTTVRGLNISGQATTTSNVGMNITTGCYAIAGTCLSTGGGGAVSSVSNSDTTLTISPTTGSVVASLNLAKANTWTALGTTTFNGSLLISTTSQQAFSVTDQYLTPIVNVNTASTTGDILDVQNTQGTVTYLNVTNNGNIGIGTTTPFGQEEISSTTANGGFQPQLVLDDQSQAVGKGAKHIYIANEGGTLYMGTTSDTYATSTSLLQPFSQTFSGPPSFAVGSSSPYAEASIQGASYNLFSSTLFAIAYGTGSATTTLLNVQNNGNVGIATTSPWRTLSVTGTVAFSGLSSATSLDSVCINATTKELVDAGSTTCLSSSKYLKDITGEITPEVADYIVDHMNAISFNYKGEDDQHYGFIAEEVAQIDRDVKLKFGVDAHLAEYAQQDEVMKNADGTSHTFKKGDPISVEYANYTAIITVYLQNHTTLVKEKTNPLYIIGFILVLAWLGYLTIRKRP